MTGHVSSRITELAPPLRITRHPDPWVLSLRWYVNVFLQTSIWETITVRIGLKNTLEWLIMLTGSMKTAADIISIRVVWQCVITELMNCVLDLTMKANTLKRLTLICNYTLSNTPLRDAHTTLFILLTSIHTHANERQETQALTIFLCRIVFFKKMPESVMLYYIRCSVNWNFACSKSNVIDCGFTNFLDHDAPTNKHTQIQLLYNTWSSYNTLMYTMVGSGLISK